MKKLFAHTPKPFLLACALLALVSFGACTPDDEPSGKHHAECNRVLAYMPAPGQFINEGYTLHTMEEACKWAENRLQQGQYVSLGAFGGYIVVGFDHPISNDGGYNISVRGNSYAGNSEPGIVWVMRDENGNGNPDDVWYELRASDTDSLSTWRDYAVTYKRPTEPAQRVAWSDNKGQSGFVDYLTAYHRQDFYYPLWAESESLTQKGTRLISHSFDVNGDGSMWRNESLPWGYADNFGSEDYFSDPDGLSCNHFRICDAIDANGASVHLHEIHFVKIQTAVLAQCGWIGEVSTEILGVRDYNLLK